MATEITRKLSLSARRAWIEIIHTAPKGGDNTVALRKESVDRNPIVPAELVTLVKSLSARRAWIEICCGTAVMAFLSVALRKESVDRNHGS